ncbi:MAG: DUF1896 domain-containing protein [Tannerella sp.]|jgi:phosphotransferase system IIA component|nr:DUF1896 domain-containing protein [Tannerella sp.]
MSRRNNIPDISFAKYSLSDGFACEPEYDLLYTEPTDSAIALYLESHKITLHRRKGLIVLKPLVDKKPL